MPTETRKGYAFNEPDLTANDKWGAIITPDEMRYVFAMGLPLIAPDGQTITNETLQWYIDNAIGNVQRDLDYWFYPTFFKARPVQGETRDDILALSSFSLKYNSAGGSGTAATFTVANGVLSTTITGQTSDNLSITLEDVASMWHLVRDINAATTTSTDGYTAVLLGRQNVAPTQLEDAAAVDIHDTTATLTADQEEDVDYFWEDPYDFDVITFRRFMYTKLRRRPVLEVTKFALYDPLGEVVMDFSNDVKVNHIPGSVEVFPQFATLASYPLLTAPTPYGVASLRTLWADRFPDGFRIDYKSGFRHVKALKARHNELFEVVGKLAAINLLADYGDGKTAGLASSSVGLSGLSESFSTTMSATSAFFGARIKQFYEDLKRWYDMNKQKYAGVFLAAV